MKINFHGEKVLKNIDDLIPYAKNSRTHSAVQIKQIEKSIQEFGFTNAVLIDDQGGIVAGHARVIAAKNLGLDKVPCIVLNDLTAAQKKAYVIADNKLALNANWDFDILKDELANLQDEFDLEILGFESDELSAILGAVFEPATEDDQGKLDQLDPKWVCCPKCGSEFDARQS